MESFKTVFRRQLPVPHLKTAQAARAGPKNVIPAEAGIQVRVNANKLGLPPARERRSTDRIVDQFFD
jgi:hypothetical protein